SYSPSSPVLCSSNAPPPADTYPLPLHDALPISEQADELQAQLDTYAGQIGSLGDDVEQARDIWFGLSDIDWATKRLSTLVDARADRKSTRLNSSHVKISYAVFCLKKKHNQSQRQ